MSEPPAAMRMIGRTNLKRQRQTALGTASFYTHFQPSMLRKSADHVDDITRKAS